MKKTHVFFAILGLLGLLGCGDKQQAASEQAAQTMRQSFEAAPADLKAKYQALTTALESNDILKAKAAWDELERLQSQMSPDQQGAAQEKKQELMLKASTAAQNGDLNAAKVVQDLRTQSRSR